MTLENIKTVCVYGAGFMGAQIGLHCAAHGYEVWLTDTAAEALERAAQSHAEELARRQHLLHLDATEAEAIRSRLHLTANIQEAVSRADLVIEAVTENLALKREIFQTLDALCPPQTILATNSSSLRISKIEDATQRPDRLVNMHFYAPLWKITMADLMRGTKTSEAVFQTAIDFVRSLAMTPLIVQKECTGFVFNRVWRAIKKETLHLVNDGVASFEDVDRAWMIFWKTSIGPFGIMDMVGLDTVRNIEEVYYRESGLESDAPPRLLLEKIAQGELGIKSGKGFYSYPNPAYANPGWLQTKTPAAEDTDGLKRLFLGAWRLRSYVQRFADGATDTPMGETPVGYLMYDASGTMSVTLMNSDYSLFATEDPTGGSAEERAAALSTYFSYCGKYVVHTDRVVHYIEACSFPNWIGKAQERFYTLEGDRLTLRTPPMQREGKDLTAHLIWERVPQR